MRRRRAVEYSSWGTDSRADTVWSAGSTVQQDLDVAALLGRGQPDDDLAQRLATSASNSSSLGSTWNSDTSVASSWLPSTTSSSSRMRRSLNRSMGVSTAGSAAALRLNTPTTRKVPTTWPSGPTSTTSMRCMGTWRWTVLTSAVRTMRTGWSGAGRARRRARRRGGVGGDAEGVDHLVPRPAGSTPSRTKLSSSSHSRRSAPSATSSAG